MQARSKIGAGGCIRGGREESLSERGKGRVDGTTSEHGIPSEFYSEADLEVKGQGGGW